MDNQKEKKRETVYRNLPLTTVNKQGELVNWAGQRLRDPSDYKGKYPDDNYSDGMW